ncbi:MAG: acetylxylan esterase [Verrucomicrobia bacterium]|nr:acetylxylan esterase [Verrucomicrobiota bacterium]
MPELSAQTEKFVPNYDESKVPDYVLPDPLEGVSTAEDWTKKRGEIYTLIEREMFGKAPAYSGDKISFAEDVDAFAILEGKARVSQPVLRIAGQDVRLLVVQPAKAASPVPAFIGYNFGGNHTVMDDSRIVLGSVWGTAGKGPRKGEEAERGKVSSRWSIERIVDAGFALVTIYYGDVDPDFDDGFKNGIFAQFPAPKAYEWGSIGGWAWSLSRVLDFLEQNDCGIDAKRVAVFGHSRLGKTSLWAGASDPRFALVISNNSGCGGAALSKRAFGETVGRINRAFPHWFCDNFQRYNENEAAMTFDAHMLLALIAPRPVYVASAEEDTWADPRGEFLACVGADPVYRLLGTEGLPQTDMPGIDKPIQGTIGYHIRSGKHDVTDFDWQHYLKFAAKHLAAGTDK